MRVALPSATLALLLATSVLGAAGQTSTANCDPNAACAAPQTGGPRFTDAEASGRVQDMSLSTTAAMLRGGSAAAPVVPAPAPQPPKPEPTPFHPLTDF